MLGGVLGLGILVSAFFLPFWNLTTGQSAAFDSLYTTLRYVLSDLAAIQNLGLEQATVLALVILLSGVMVMAAGLFGVFPLGSGILGLLAMAGLTFGPTLLFPSYVVDRANYGTGFWAIWAMSLLLLVAASWARRRGKGVQVAGSVPQADSVMQPTPAD